MSSQPDSGICAILLDYGGVVAEEGFREGLMAIGRSTVLGADRFFEVASDTVYDSGYLIGQAEEHDYWNMVRQRTRVERTDEEMRLIILRRFVLRQWMLDLARNLRSSGYTVCILSDQTQWLDQLDKRDNFFRVLRSGVQFLPLGKGQTRPECVHRRGSQLTGPTGEDSVRRRQRGARTQGTSQRSPHDPVPGPGKFPQRDARPRTGVIRLRFQVIPIRFCLHNLAQVAGRGSPLLRTTQGRLITSLRRSPAPRSYSCESESV